MNNINNKIKQILRQDYLKVKLPFHNSFQYYQVEDLLFKIDFQNFYQVEDLLFNKNLNKKSLEEYE